SDDQETDASSATSDDEETDTSSTESEEEETTLDKQRKEHNSIWEMVKARWLKRRRMDTLHTTQDPIQESGMIELDDELKSKVRHGHLIADAVARRKLLKEQEQERLR